MKLFLLLTFVLSLCIISFASFGDNSPTWEEVDEYKKLQHAECDFKTKHYQDEHVKKEEESKKEANVFWVDYL